MQAPYFPENACVRDDRLCSKAVQIETHVSDTWKVWELKLHFYPSTGGLKKKKREEKSSFTRVCTTIVTEGRRA